jgi:bifunctional enzyme CysN/CysC
MRTVIGGINGAGGANIRWEHGHVDRQDRCRMIGTGATIWMTGLPASGKSTIARKLEEQLVLAGRPAYRLDGDNLRHGLNADLGFDHADRTENVRRAAHVARLFADAGVLAIVSLISPYASDRALAREIHVASQLPFLEVFVDTPLEECERRDPKGLYAKARCGELKLMTGVDDPYEPPVNPDVVVRTLEDDTPGAVARIISALDTSLSATARELPR